MKSMKHSQAWFFLVLVLASGLVYALEAEKAEQSLASPTDGYIKSVQFIVSIYQENSTSRAGAEKVKESNATESMRIGDGQAAFIGTSQDLPIPVITAGNAENKASVKAVEYKRLESGVELRPHLMGRFVQLQIVEKNQHWNAETKTIETSTSHSVATLPLDQWTKVKGTLNDNEDIEDIYSTHRDTNTGLWVKIELAPN